MEHDHMIEAFATNGANHPLDIGALPRRARCRQDFANAHVSHVFSEVIAKDRIVVAQEVARELGKGKCLAQLLSGPICGRVGGHIEVQDATPVMGQNQKYVKDLEPDGGHGEEVDRDQLLGMVLQEGAPSLRRRFAAAHHIFADTALSDVDAEFEKFAWIRGASQPGFSRHILRIRSRTSLEMTGRPGFPQRTLQVQNKRKAARCQATTVSGLTMANAERQSRQRRDRQIHSRRSPAVNLGRFPADLWSTPI